jgi:molybdopterin-guanine dinucleotide biosynthesis protein A
MNFSAVILAGGKSSRMGRDKAFIEIGGRTLLNRQIATLVEAGTEEIFISGRADVNYAAFGCRVLTDAFLGIGPLAGIHAALKISRRPLTLVLAVDLPEMSALFLRSLLMASAPDRGVVPRVGGHVEPLAAVYPHAALPIIERQMAHGDHAAQSFAAACVQAGLATYEEIDGEFTSLFKNLNSPTDLLCPT